MTPDNPSIDPFDFDDLPDLDLEVEQTPLATQPAAPEEVASPLADVELEAPPLAEAEELPDLEDDLPDIELAQPTQVVQEDAEEPTPYIERVQEDVSYQGEPATDPEPEQVLDLSTHVAMQAAVDQEPEAVVAEDLIDEPASPEDQGPAFVPDPQDQPQTMAKRSLPVKWIAIGAAVVLAVVAGAVVFWPASDGPVPAPAIEPATQAQPAVIEQGEPVVEQPVAERESAAAVAADDVFAIPQAEEPTPPAVEPAPPAVEKPKPKVPAAAKPRAPKPAPKQEEKPQPKSDWQDEALKSLEAFENQL